ncbi:hypothetical protein AK830_g4818 [Neonectria ditissima]|uniref:Ubiquitin-like domain-containing protein n=1 Tax=Neonectria ditissima TaxID=78410 RepID=A0A0P7B792_9HYPO|nr:hypothetical protein AK830_g4818 [Neonectria ditissima]
MTRVEHRLSDGFTASSPYEDLKIKCYHSRRVPDPPDPRLQEIYDVPSIEPSCQASLAVETTPEPSTGKSQFYIPAESETALAFTLESKSLYKVRILIGGQNICSFARGEHDDESQIQDYFVTSAYLPIHGVFVKKDLVRQLVAVESEKPKLRLTSKFYITICTLTGTAFALDEIHNDTTIEEMKNRIHAVTGVLQDQQRLIYKGKPLEDRRTLGDYVIPRAHVVHLVLRLRGGGGDDYGIRYPTPPPELVEPPTTIAPGGFISQKLNPDPVPGDWCEQPAQTVNLRVVNYEKFTSITGLSPKAPSPDEVAKISLRRCKTQQFRPSADEEIHLRGIGEIHEETGIHINGPYDVKRPREVDAEVERPLTWRRILFCGC